MKLFACPNCAQPLYFENTVCLACGSKVLYEPGAAAFILADENSFACLNAEECECNWSAGGEGQGYCLACSLNRTIPDLTIGGNRERWIRVERAKKRLVYSLLAFRLPVRPKSAPGDEAGIAFDFLADAGGDGPQVLTGHDNGLITLNVAEADSAERERRRIQMHEPYRTLLGHFRHEIGHYYWDRLIRDRDAWLGRYRELFGDETADYAAALERHYAGPPAAGWQERHISSYAASHSWEDWAETWAHYLHIVDTLEMAESLDYSFKAIDRAAGLLVTPDLDDAPVVATPSPAGRSFERVLARWIVLSNASNSINRCMGLPDLYPFVISETVAAKLAFVDELLGEQRGGD
jgi:hypothetical protein